MVCWEKLQQYKNKLLQIASSRKLYIIDIIDDNLLLNKRNVFTRGCKDQNKLLLKNIKWNLNCFSHTHDTMFLYW